MTNEENIHNAATNYGYAVAGGSIDRGCIQDAFETGAKWKDAQFMEYLEKKRDENHPYWNGYECLGAESIINEIINELLEESK